MTEEDLRGLGGAPAAPEVTFLGETYKICEDGLAALLRFTRGSASDNPEQGTPLPVLYRLLEDCVIDFSTFSQQALANRADITQISPVIDHLVSWYCGRNHWPAMRLLGYVAGNLEELDGQLIRAGGRGVAALSAREACNVALAVCLEGRSAEDREIFMTDLNFEGNPEADALAQLRAFQAQQAAAKEEASQVLWMCRWIGMTRRPICSWTRSKSS